MIIFMSCDGSIFFEFDLRNSPSALTKKILFGANSLSGGSESFGTAGHDLCNAITVDTGGNLYCAGFTTDAIEPGALVDSTGDAFVMKIGPSGDLIWVTQLDSTKPEINNSEELDVCQAVKVDNMGNVYCGGYTHSNFVEPNGSGSSKDAFVAKLSSDGSITWVRHFGQNTASSSIHINNLSGEDGCNDIAIDGAGNIYCGGSSDGNFAEPNGGSYDIIVTKLDTDGDILWATQLGSTSLSSGESSAKDSCESLDIDNSGNIYCGGYTEGNLNEAISGSYDAVVVKFNNSGALDWITQLGSATGVSRGDDYSAGENCGALSVAKNGNSIYCAGETQGATSDINAGGYDLFAFNINPSTGNVNWVTQLGDTREQSFAGHDYSGNESCTSKVVGLVTSGISDVDTDGNFYVSCSTNGSTVESYTGAGSLFITKFSPTGNIDWVTQFGDSYDGTSGSAIPMGLKVYNDKLVVSGLSISQDFLGETSNNTSGYDPFILIMNTDGSY
ncbi:SBBP repeat-containing protein [Bacteriovorax sp. BAL6_X]|uniref:SBBP repeat-containing protein n=1 Tax=Bacteriovorax sp. BAL6_X TaxID=1201290 RepID=UPI0018DBEDBA|nr:SBBP repeat-containing protein [Bacteriovorax sp. BAL6_X]